MTVSTSGDPSCFLAQTIEPVLAFLVFRRINNFHRFQSEGEVRILPNTLLEPMALISRGISTDLALSMEDALGHTEQLSHTKSPKQLRSV